MSRKYFKFYVLLRNRYGSGIVLVSYKISNYSILVVYKKK